jgi:HNH endonuclease
MESFITCIYCKQKKPQPSRGEHIVQDGLGGSTCIPCVCAECNTGVLKTLDQEFLRNSPVGLLRVFASNRGELRSPQFVPTEEFGGWLDCAVRAPSGPRGPEVRVLPQVIVRDGHLATVIRTVDRDSATAALRQLQERGAMHCDINARPQNRPTRLVLAPKEKKNKYSFTLRAQSREEADEFLRIYYELAADYWKTAVWKDADPRLGTVLARTDTEVNVPGRCAAKMAFNLLAHYFGADIALGAGFDAVRGYILGRGILPVQQVIASDGEVGLTVDHRFVGPWYRHGPTDHWCALKGGHTVILNCQLSVVWALVHLFDGAMTFALQLGKLESHARIEGPLPVFLFTAADGAGDRLMTVEEVIKRVAPGLLRDSEEGPYDGPRIERVE